MPMNDNDVFEFLGTQNDDPAVHGYHSANGAVLETSSDDVTHVNGREGSDEISTGNGNTLAAGDMVGGEWAYVDGKWVYNAEAVVVSDYGMAHSFDDTIVTGQGNDVLLGNGGSDVLRSGAGDDIVNAGRGDDKADGGAGNDILNLENGDDYAEGGLGDDIVNAGEGNDVIYGDIKGENLLVANAKNATTFSGLAQSGAWKMTDTFGVSTISQSLETTIGKTYTISFELAANLAGGHAAGKVEVLWNGAVVDTVETQSGVYQTYKVDVTSDGQAGDLSFRALEAEDTTEYDFSGPIVTYDKTISVGEADVNVKAFAAGQAKLYQVIDGHLKVFDVQAKEYTDVGTNPGFKINAVGFNVENDMIYGVAKSAGLDSLGNAVSTTDIVAVDGAGATYRVGEGFYGDYVGDFDSSGNLWTFHTALNRLSVVDVDRFDENGDPVIQHFKLPTGLFTDRTYDLAFNAQDGNFYAVVSPNQNGADGKVVKIDVGGLAHGGMPVFSEIAITGTLYGTDMENGLAKGAYGAVFMDGESNLYYGLNKGDHDLDGATATQGAIFKVNMDWETGQAYSEFMSEAPATGSNDGAVDPRSADAFSEIDANAAVLIRDPSVSAVEGGNDTLRGGNGEDEIHGNDGDDDLNGGSGDDALFGDQGNDKLSGGTGHDAMSGGSGDDKLRGETGNDVIFGNDGADFLDGGSGNDDLSGGAGVDKIVGGTGSDMISGGAGNDHIWGGAWTADDAADTFIFESGSGKDYIHDFEADMDMIDLSAFGVDYQDVEQVTLDLGWATVIDLQHLSGGQDGDRIVLKAVDADDLDAANFVFDPETVSLGASSDWSFNMGM